MSARHLNYNEFLRSIYHESDQARPSQYVPKAPDKKKAILRGASASAVQKKANSLFTRLMKGAS